MQVDWNPPEPRAGLAGQWDRFMGPGLRPAEFWLILLPSLLMTIGVILYASAQNLGWTAVQTLVAAIITFDLTGGVITNATSTAKRWYHRSGQGVKEHLGFTAVHFIHLLLVAWLFRGGDWLYLTVTYGYLLVTAVFIARANWGRQRPLAMLCWMGGLLLSLYAFTPTPGLEWLLPFFYAKLLVSHLVKEAPFAV
ncbi:MAG: hypothetical protein IPF56_13010 [Chloroflexi bacterium]|jgi:hypothetical protein|nr:hypothetical protein [Chloroflexota bacterium]MBK7179006.1 hypothetical protein [Chloroflexota bacterium]MBK8933636.1 hypothetical protein [Chloroflexota bacterium]MBP7593139.1 hypothetical protein [Chloroflexota bacterium]